MKKYFETQKDEIQYFFRVSVKKMKSTQQKRTSVIPIRSGGKPSCDHNQCCWKYKIFLKKKSSSCSVNGNDNNDDDEDNEAQEKIVQKESILKKSVPSSWLGPCGVSTVFFRRVGKAPTSTTATATNTSSSSNAAVKTIGLARNESEINFSPNGSGFAFIVGFDMYKSKYSVCSGTMSDSWQHDKGCAVRAGMRESHEEFKFEFKSPEEYLQLSSSSSSSSSSSNCSLFWWEASTCCFAIDLDQLTDDDPRKSFSNLQKGVAAAVGNRSLPQCQREVSSLSWFVVPEELVLEGMQKQPDYYCQSSSTSSSTVSDPIFTKQVVNRLGGTMSSFGLLCISRTIRKVLILQKQRQISTI